MTVADPSSLLAATRRPLAMPHHPLHRFYTGGALTHAFRRLPLHLDSQWSEDWVASTTTANNPDPDGQRQGLSTVRLDDHTTCTLDTLVRAHPEAMLGAATLQRYGPQTGLLVKILSPAGPVPLHAHPSRPWARRHLHSPHGKTEAWILLDTPGDGQEPAYAGIGFREGVTRDWFTRAVAARDHAALRESLHRTEIHPGEVYVAAGGVPHFLGPRELFVEIQEPSDHIVVPESDGSDDHAATMGLGWSTALDMIDFTTSSEADVFARARQHPTVVRSDAGSAEHNLFASWVDPYFGARRVQVDEQHTVEDNRFQILIVTAGDGLLRGDFDTIAIQSGDAFAVPASVPYHLQAGSSSLTAIRCLGPDPEGNDE